MGTVNFGMNEKIKKSGVKRFFPIIEITGILDFPITFEADVSAETVEDCEQLMHTIYGILTGEKSDIKVFPGGSSEEEAEEWRAKHDPDYSKNSTN